MVFCCRNGGIKAEKEKDKDREKGKESTQQPNTSAATERFEIERKRTFINLNEGSICPYKDDLLHSHKHCMRSES